MNVEIYTTNTYTFDATNAKYAQVAQLMAQKGFDISVNACVYEGQVGDHLRELTYFKVEEQTGHWKLTVTLRWRSDECEHHSAYRELMAIMQ